MRLVCFGEARLEAAQTRLSPQLILLLSYIRLEAETSRHTLAGLFWPHLAGEYSAKGERKDLNNASVALASLRRASGLAPEDLYQLSCDAQELAAAFQRADYSKVVDLYDVRGFLAELEHSPRLKLSEPLFEWLLECRAQFQSLAFAAYLKLAEAGSGSSTALSGNPSADVHQAIELMPEEVSPSDLERCHQLVRQLDDSALEQALQPHLDRFIRVRLVEPYLSPEAQDLLLLLSLQTQPNLAAARMAANLSPKQAMLAVDELVEVGLLDDQQQLTAAATVTLLLARDSSRHLQLLSALRDYTPESEASGIFQQLYDLSQSFGGLGYWHDASQAYLSEARKLVSAKNWPAALTLFKAFVEAETRNGVTPHSELHFLYAYVLNRVARYKEAEQVLVGVHETPEVKGIKSALLFRAGKHSEAQRLATEVYTDVSSSDWAKAMAANSLGAVDQTSGNLQQAQYYFEQAAIHYSYLDMPDRSLGARLNRANVLVDLALYDDACKILRHVVCQSTAFAGVQARAYLALAHALSLQNRHQDAVEVLARALNRANWATSHPGLYSRIINDQTYARWKLASVNATEAASLFQDAMNYAKRAGDRNAYARAATNQGMVERDLVKFEAGLSMLAPNIAKALAGGYLPYYCDIVKEHLQAAQMRGDTTVQAHLEAKLEQLETEAQLPLKH
ncbi:MAG: hypothetical protein AAF708_05670 [Deinococcota bacterium]